MEDFDTSRYLSEENKKEQVKIKKAGWGLIVIWSLVILLLAGWNFFQISTSYQELALVSLRNTIDKDFSFRNWAADHGGVYVSVTEQNPPNPYLEHIEERDIVTPSGKNLTLVNPAYIMRQVYQKSKEMYDVYGRLASLNPVNPLNTADLWEADALRKFVLGEADEVFAQMDFNGVYSMRLIEPFYAEEGCLKCHPTSRVGDFRGGISVATPMEPYIKKMYSSYFVVGIGYLLILLMGLTVISSTTSRILHVTKVQRESEVKYRTIVENIDDALYVYTFNGDIIDVNKNAGKMLGYQRQELLGIKLSKILKDKDNYDNYFYGIEKEVVDEGRSTFEDIHLTKEGSKIPVEVDTRVISSKEEGVIQSFVRDISKRKKDEEKIRYLSFHDSLTGLYNRAFLEQEVKRLNTQRQLPISIIFADINNLKKINDTYGHYAGDEVLVKAADVFKKSCREEDIIARWGGDEFVVLLPKTNETEAKKICSRITEESDKYFVKGNLLSISLGVAFKADIEEDIEVVFAKAENNMYEHKHKHKQEKNN